MPPVLSDMMLKEKWGGWQDGDDARDTEEG